MLEQRQVLEQLSEFDADGSITIDEEEFIAAAKSCCTMLNLEVKERPLNQHPDASLKHLEGILQTTLFVCIVWVEEVGC